MARPRILTDEERKIKRQEYNARPEHREKRKINERKRYERKKLVAYTLEHGSDEGFNYKYLFSGDKI